MTKLTECVKGTIELMAASLLEEPHVTYLANEVEVHFRHEDAILDAREACSGVKL